MKFSKKLKATAYLVVFVEIFVHHRFDEDGIVGERLRDDGVRLTRPLHSTCGLVECPVGGLVVCDGPLVAATGVPTVVLGQSLRRVPLLVDLLANLAIVNLVLEQGPETN